MLVQFIIGFGFKSGFATLNSDLGVGMDLDLG